MALVTLTTDYGLRDHYLATLKGTLLKQDPDIRMIDISHDIENYNIVQAAYLFSNAWKAFPAGTIHLLSINDFDNELPQALGLKQDEHYFIGPDNGLFSLIFDEIPQDCHHISIPLEQSTPFAATYAKAVAHIVRTNSLDGLGTKTKTITQRLSFHPIIGPAMIQGNVIYIDNYDNAITNIRQDLFQKVGQGREFALFFKRNDPIKRLVEHYHQAPLGSALCRFNSAGYLEVAINKGKAVSLLGLSVEDTVQVKFKA